MRVQDCGCNLTLPDLNSRSKFTRQAQILMVEHVLNVFTVVPCILVLSSLLFIQLNAQLDCSKRMLKLTLKFTLKALLHVSV
jgi:hypothetical protein